MFELRQVLISYQDQHILLPTSRRPGGCGVGALDGDAGLFDATVEAIEPFFRAAPGDV
jgi:hypothetical protein